LAAADSRILWLDDSAEILNIYIYSSDITIMAGPCCLLLGHVPYSDADLIGKPGGGRETLATRIYMGTHDMMRIRLERRSSSSVASL
jgi:hypothetical protein